MKIDIYSHAHPKKYAEALYKRVPNDRLLDTMGRQRNDGILNPTGKAFSMPRSAWDSDFRVSIMDKFDGLVQVLTPTNLPLELIANPSDSAYLAQVYNDSLAEMVAEYPKKFVAAVAIIPLNNIDFALKEIDRTIKQLGFKGICIHTPIYDLSTERRKPLDLPEIMPVYQAMAKYDLPIWIHPRRQSSQLDYTTDERSKYGLQHIFGWPYETSLAMGRLVFCGVFDKYPNIKFITHHCGAMVPYFADRIVETYAFFDKSTHAGLTDKLKRPAIEYFKMFYNDTALNGNSAALMCGYEFFGKEHILFGSDFPYDVEQGDVFTRKTIDAINSMKIPEADKNYIFEGNAKKLLKLDI